MSRDASSVAQTKARPTGPPAFPGRATASRDQRFSRITRHETRITAFLPHRQPRRLQGGCTKRGKTSGKRFFLNPETRITTFSESGFGSRFGIRHNSSLFVGKIRISPCRQSSAPAHRRPVAAFLRVVARHGAAVARHGRHIAPEQCPRSRPPFAQPPSPSGIVPVRRTQKDPMLSRRNVPYCVDKFMQKTGATVGAPDERVELDRAPELHRSFDDTNRAVDSRISWTESARLPSPSTHAGSAKSCDSLCWAVEREYR